MILWGLRRAFFEAFCNSAQHLVGVVQDAADFPELALREEDGGVGLGQLAAQRIELLDALALAAGQVADGPAGDEADAGGHQHAEKGCGGVVIDAVFAGGAEACSWSTRWMVVRETR